VVHPSSGIPDFSPFPLTRVRAARGLRGRPCSPSKTQVAQATDGFTHGRVNYLKKILLYESDMRRIRVESVRFDLAHQIGLRSVSRAVVAVLAPQKEFYLHGTSPGVWGSSFGRIEFERTSGGGVRRKLRCG
jgi:hypothetical protein